MTTNTCGVAAGWDGSRRWRFVTAASYSISALRPPIPNTPTPHILDPSAAEN